MDAPSPRPVGRVVVGVSGSEASVEALAWALDVADGRGWSVDVVAAWPDLGEPFIHEVPGHYCDSRGRVVAGVRRALSRCAPRQDVPAIRVCVENADPVQALTTRSRGADLLVVGASGSGRSSRRGLPRVGETCRLVVDCPTVVVEPPDNALT
jgi:nucleotide-binding universal stress UspA family protein